jgi:hypothetical protein
MSSKRQQKPHMVYQKLTCIRQTGTKRLFDGTVIYTFVAQVSKKMLAQVCHHQKPAE